MNLRIFTPTRNTNRLQSQLLMLAGVFLALYSLVLTLSPAVRYHSWDVDYRWQHWIGFAVWVLISYLLNRFSSKFRHRDPMILPIILMLIGWGLLSIFRLNPYFGFRQTVWFFLGASLIAVGFFRPDFLKEIRKFKYIWLTLGLLITGLTFFFGIYPLGTGPRLWFEIGGFFVQPSEPLKLLFIIYLSAYLADKWPTRRNIVALLTPTAVFIGAAVLILIAQRDLGTATIFILLFAFYMFLVTEKRRTLVIFFVLLLIAGLAGYQFFAVIQNRVDAWLNPWLDPAGISYQVVQSLQAIAAGKFIGAGPGIGSPGIVPVALSDFIFVVIAEELGLAGSLALFSLYAILAYRGFLIAIKANNQYQRLLTAGLTTLIIIQAILILGGNIGLLPLTGVTLPFISYGGSSLLTFSIAGILLLWTSQNRNPRSVTESDFKPYRISVSAILAVFAVMALVSGYWGIIRSNDLLARNDNLRKVINDRYVIRGEILDRNNQSISFTNGTVGEYFRTTYHPELSLTIGFLNPLYGINGLELTYDDYLRGIEGVPSSDLIFTDLLFAQPPEGLDVRISLDLKLQNKLETALEDQQGAALLMNAKNGEILAIWSAPTYDSNSLDENFETWKNDENSPMLNRVTQGQYPLGTAVIPFLEAYYQEEHPQSFMQSGLNQESGAICLFDPSDDTKNGDGINCGTATVDVANISQINPQSFIGFFGWGEAITFDLPLAENEPNLEITNTDDLLTDVVITPLQLAATAALFSNSGNIINPHLGTAVKTPQEGWVIFPIEDPTPLIARETAAYITEMLASANLPLWEISGTAESGETDIIWFISGTQFSWQGTPMVFVLALENSSIAETTILGESFFNDIILGEK